MVYNYVSGRQVVAILYNDLGVNSTSWEQNAPRWITDGLLRLGTLKGLEKKEEDVIIENYIGKVPHHCRRIDSIEYNNSLVTLVQFNGRLNNRDSFNLHYAQINANHIEFDTKEATLKVKYRALPITLDEETNVYFPLIPDSPEVKQYLGFYLLQLIMINGFKHPVFSFDSKNPDTNIGVLVTKCEKLAKSKINKMSKTEREEIAKEMGSMFTDYNLNRNKDFNYDNNQ